MKARIAACPACGGPVSFQVSTSLVTVCDFCHSVVARGDKKPEDCGKIADVVDLNSPLSVGMTGSVKGKAFHVTGRVQYKHPSGAMWNEWYLSFPGDRWGWLAEAQGKLYLMFEQRLKTSSALAEFQTIQLGQTFEVREESLQVTEKAIATVAAAEGEIPWAVRPGLPHAYVDLKSEKGYIGTLDFSDSQPKFFLGKSVTLESLGMTPNSSWSFSKDISVQALQLQCPNCAGALQLFAPDQTLRVACPNCHALLDAQQGNLVYLETLADRDIKPILPLGSKGTLFGKQYTVVGFMQRYVMYEGRSYPWSEYLLYNPEVHFRWLVRTDDGHWSFVEQIDHPGNNLRGLTTYFEGQSFRLYEQGEATVSYVVGEFPWQVRMGERTLTRDYISPPYMLSLEQSIADVSGDLPVGTGLEASDPPASDRAAAINQEVNVSKGVYVTVDEIEQAFALKNLRRPLGVGTIQPAPQMGFRFLYANVGFLIALVSIYALGKWLRSSKPPDGTLLMIAMVIVTIFPLLTLFYKFSFETQRWRNSDYSPYPQSE